jgi:hypothetical protein
MRIAQSRYVVATKQAHRLEAVFSRVVTTSLKEKRMEVQVNTGFLMPNTRKESDTHADYTGTWVDADGVEFYLSAWSNVSKKSGMPYFKLKLGKAKGAAPAYHPPAQQVAQKRPPAKFPDDDIPF